jgi:hypothetical protein
MGDQPGHGGAAGSVGVEDLGEEDPEGDQGREDAVLPARWDRVECPLKARGREDVGEGEAVLLEELPAEGVDLLTKVAVLAARHHSGSGWGT